jgi:hypothetical protein
MTRPASAGRCRIQSLLATGDVPRGTEDLRCFFLFGTRCGSTAFLRQTHRIAETDAALTACPGVRAPAPWQPSLGPFKMKDSDAFGCPR